jgi:hypothetical protein
MGKTLVTERELLLTLKHYDLDELQDVLDHMYDLAMLNDGDETILDFIDELNAAIEEVL